MTTKRGPRKNYSIPFKQMVIADYLRGMETKASIRRKYDISFSGAIQYWLKELGFSDIAQKDASLISPILSSLVTKNNSSEPQPSISALQQRIKELERLLEDEQLRSDGYNRMIEHAEKELKVSIRKKPSTK